MLDTRRLIIAATLFIAAMAVSHYFMGVDRLHVIIRPDLNGDWFIQRDGSHASRGVAAVRQLGDGLVIEFARRYPKPMTIQISTDDGFGAFVSAHGNLGRRDATIRLYANGAIIDPRTIWDHLPPDRREQHNGNLWIDVTMSKWPGL